MAFFEQLISKGIRIVPRPLLWLFAKRYIAGEDMQDAVRVSQDLNSKGIKVSIAPLGEYAKSRAETLQFKNQAKEILHCIKRQGLDANMSIKPTQLGLKLDRHLALDNIRDILELARELDNFVRIDMEDTSCTQDTLDVYVKLQAEYPANVGAVLQSYLRRTARDIENMPSGNLNIRLCKGIYRESLEQAHQHPEVINKNFIFCLQKLLARKAYVAIATHDPRLIYDAFVLVQEYTLSDQEYELQMLLGVSMRHRDLISAQGHRMRVYVPFGGARLPYARRRLQENPDIARYVLRQVLRGDFNA